MGALPLFLVECAHGLNNSKSNWSKFITYSNFKLLPLRYVQVLLGSDDLTLTEEVLWTNCILWATYQFEKENGTQEVVEKALPPPC